VKHLKPEILKKVLESEVLTGPIVSGEAFSGLSIDSRKIKPGEIFFAIVGDKNDGHNFVLNAFEQGAAAAVVNRSRLDDFKKSPPGTIFAVDDTHEALLNLAAYIRRRTDANFAAITGSNGKTTTKEMFYAIARTRHKTFRSPGNLNNLYGLPISLGSMPDDVEYAIFELGISTPGEMNRLASVIKPELAVITNIGPAHLEKLGSIENVVKAKFELVDNLPVGAVVVLNADDPLIMAEAKRRGLDYIGFGIEQKSDFTATDIELHKDRGLAFTVNGQKITLPVYGRINVYNALAAIAASSVWDCGPEQWAEGLAAFRNVDMRLEIENFRGMILMIDCYNSNPDSVTNTLISLKEYDVTGNKIAILGDMLELGDASGDYHYRAGEEAARSGISRLFCLGPQSRQTVLGAVAAGMDEKRIYHSLEHQDLLDHILKVIAPGDLVLCKGSRGMQMEKIVIGLKGSAFKNN